MKLLASSLSLLVVCACARPPPSKQAVAELSIRLSQRSTDAVSRALSPVDVIMVNAPCDSGLLRVRSTVDGARRTDELQAQACKHGDETFTGDFSIATASMTRMGNTLVVEQTINGSLAYEGPTYSGTIRYDDLKFTSSITVVDGMVRIESELNGTVTIGGTTYAFDKASYAVVDTRPPTGGGAGGGSGGGAAGGSAGGVVGATVITGATGVTDLAVVGETAYFTGDLSGTQPAIFSASSTATAATVLCTGPMDSKLAGVVVDGSNVWALASASSGMRKLLRGSISGTGVACQEVATVDAKGFFFTALAPMAKVGDGLVYLAEDGSLKRFDVTSSTESVLVPAQAGTGFFELIGSTGTIGVVAQAQPAGATPALKTFGTSGLAETLASFSNPEFTTVGSRVLWAVDASGGAVTFKFRETTSGAVEASGATASVGVPGRINLSFCETNDGSAAGFAIAKSSDSAAGFYAVGLDANAPRKLSSQAFDIPVHCAVTATRLWMVEGDVGGSRNLLRVSR